MRKTPDGSPLPGGSQGGIENLYAAHIEAWAHFWRHLQVGSNGLDTFASDMGRLWYGWLSGLTNLTTAGRRAPDATGVPNVAFVIDREASTSDPQTVTTPGLRAGAHPSVTSWECLNPVVATQISQVKVRVTGDPASCTMDVQLAGVQELRRVLVPWQSASGTALIYQDRTPLARLILVLK